nr:unnamed protein product [Digitaria exilis]
MHLSLAAPTASVGAPSPKFPIEPEIFPNLELLSRKL